MKAAFLDFKGPTKVPANIEEKLGEELSKGKLKAVNVCENQGGRLYVSIFIDEKESQNAMCKVFRDARPEKIKEDVSKLLSEGVTIKSTHYTVSTKSNQLMMLLFYEP